MADIQCIQCKNHQKTSRLKLEARCLSADAGLFVQDLPEPNRAWLLRVYVVAPNPLLSLYGNGIMYACDLVYQTPTKTYWSEIPVAFGIPGNVTTKHVSDTPC